MTSAVANNERGGRGNRAINIGRFKTYKARTQFDNWGRKRCENLNGSQQFPNDVMSASKAIKNPIMVVLYIIKNLLNIKALSQMTCK